MNKFINELESTRSTLNGNVKTNIFVHIYQDIFEIVFEEVERNRLIFYIVGPIFSLKMNINDISQK